MAASTGATRTKPRAYCSVLMMPEWPQPESKYESARGVENQRLIVRNGVLNPGGTCVDFGACGIILFWIRARNRPAEPDTRKKLFGFFMDHEDAAGSFVVFFHLDHGIGIVAATFQENTLRDVNAGERLRIRFGKFAAQSHKAGGVVVMKVAENHVLHIAEIDFQFAGVFQNGVRAGAGIEKNFVTIGFDECGKTPFADAVIGEHRGKDRDFEGVKLGMRSGGGGLRGDAAWSSNQQKNNERKNNTECFHGRILLDQMPPTKRPGFSVFFGSN